MALNFQRGKRVRVPILQPVKKYFCSVPLSGFAAWASVFLSRLVLLGVVGSLAAQDFKAARLVAHPPVLDLSGAAAQHNVIVTALDSSGSATDVTSQARYTSSRPELIAISTDGSVRALADGVAEIVIQFGGKSVKVPVTPSARARTAPSVEIAINSGREEV